MSTRVQIVFYSMYGHVHKLAQAVAAGVQEVPGAQVQLLQVPELMPEDALEKSGAKAARAEFAAVPVAAPGDLAAADAIIFGTPTRFGNMCAQMRNFLDQTGGLWMSGALVGKVGSVFTSTATQHGGQELAIITTQASLQHHGMIIVPLSYAWQGQSGVDQVRGGSPYGMTLVTATDGSRMPSELDLEGVKFQGKRVAEIAAKLHG